MNRAHDLADGRQALVDLRQARLTQGGHPVLDHLLAQCLRWRAAHDQLLDGVVELEDLEDADAAVKARVRAMVAPCPALEDGSLTADRLVEHALFARRLVGSPR